MKYILFFMLKKNSGHFHQIFQAIFQVDGEDHSQEIENNIKEKREKDG